MNLLLLTLLIGNSFSAKLINIDYANIRAYQAQIQLETPKQINIEANRIITDNFKELFSKADFVGIVQSDKNFSEQKHEFTYTEDWFLWTFFTRTDVKILEVFKWDLQVWEDFEIIEPNAIVPMNGEKFYLVMDNYQPLKPNKPYIVFLKKNSYGEYAIFNMNESVFPKQKIYESRSEDNFSHPSRKKIYEEILKKGWIE